MTELRTILELIYFVSGPFLAFVAILGLRQIKEARNQVIEAKSSRILSAKRDAFKIAADKCTYYMEIIIPLMNNLDASIKEKKVTFFEKSVVTLGTDNIKLKPHPLTEQEKETLYSLPLTELFNPLESFALFFTSGVADEQVGYLTIGHTYCNYIKEYLPILVILSKDRSHYNNIMRLFFIWQGRKEKQRLESEKKKIEKELSGNKEIIVKPIGTE
jgi:hypothetical protein